MNMTSVFAGTVGGLAIAGSAVAGMNGLSYDIHGNDLIPGTYTVRMYAEVDAGNRVDAVFGNTEHNMSISYYGGASAYQNSLGGPTSTSINPAFFALAPSLEWDSYVTIGSLYAPNALQDIGISWSSWDPDGGDLFSNNGTFFITPADPQGEESGGRVLIAQCTTFAGSGSYDMTCSAGFQGKDASGATWQSGHSVDITGEIIPAPGAMALLGLAGLAGRRRRRG